MVKFKAIALNGSLKASSNEQSSTDALIKLLAEKFSGLEIEVSPTIRLVDHDIKPGVTSDEGSDDAWPEIRDEILAHDILIFGTPIWMGQMSSVAKRALERMDAFVEEAVVAVVGNEDGAHSVAATAFQALNDTGFTIPAVAACYWVGEAMGSVDFKDLKSTPSKIDETAAMVTSNAAHLARLLKSDNYPG